MFISTFNNLVSKTARELKEDMKKIFEPNVAARLKERQSNTLKDFMHVAGALNVSHFWIFSATDLATYLRIAKFPRGPTLAFRVLGILFCCILIFAFFLHFFSFFFFQIFRIFNNERYCCSTQKTKTSNNC
jgi:hypothetical protein